MLIQSQGVLFFRFEGIVALCVKRGEYQFDAAIVKNTRNETGEIDDHAHSIEIVKWKDRKKQESDDLPVFDYRNPARLLRLDLHREPGSSSPSSPSGIQFFPLEEDDQPESARDNGFDRTIAFLFDWVIDAKERRSDTVQVNEKALRTRLRVTGIDLGLFIPGAIRATPASLIIPSSSRFWGSAESLNAIIPLPNNGATLRKINAHDVIERDWPLPYEDKVCYEIIVKNTCEKEICSVDTTEIYDDLTKSDRNGKREIEFLMPSSLTNRQIKQLTDLPLSDWRDLIPLSAGPLICPTMNFSDLPGLPEPALPGA
jgi:hypothetical protein